MSDRTRVETLRAAAQRLREASHSTTPDRWQLLSYQIVATFDDDCEDITEVALTYGHEANARWIALVGPLLAEPLAAWLESVAALQFGQVPLPDSPIVDHALKVAGVILREAT
ncbi:hypothetical protein J5X84_36345 [Streptosporangiaceae bacterium NEAU-GS5]|nr:hypothetical protein [Streptosporangiaceae bacterium NEAU-GS5]